MTQAILILLHNKINYQVTKLIDYFQGQCDIFIHVDKDCILTEAELGEVRKKPGVIEVYQKYHVNWAGFNMLKTEIFLLKEAMKLSDFKYVHILSGNDYPIKPLSYFIDFFNNTDREYVSCTHIPHPNTDNNTFLRYQNFFFADWFVVKKDEDVSKLWKIANKLAEFGIRRRIPDQFPHLYDGSQWFSLSRSCIKALLNYTSKHPSFYRHMRFCYAPEEIYINTFVMNTIPSEKLGNGNMRYIYWPFRNAQHPKTLTDDDFLDFAFSDAFFARKINEEDGSILIEKINQLLLKEEMPSYLSEGQKNQQVVWNYTADEGLLNAIVYLCHLLGIKDVIDLGCGSGYYVFKLRREKIMARGVDGNPNTTWISNKICDSKYPCGFFEMHRPTETTNIADMALMINVGEYIPNKYMSIVLNNVCKLSKKYVIISWLNTTLLEEIRHKTEVRHSMIEADLKHVVNPIEEEILVKELEQRGYEKDLLMTDFLQNRVNYVLHSNILAFRKMEIVNKLI